jgi:hypothetical protein
LDTREERERENTQPTTKDTTTTTKNPQRPFFLWLESTRKAINEEKNFGEPHTHNSKTLV